LLCGDSSPSSPRRWALRSPVGPAVQFDPGGVIAVLGIILLIFGVVQLFNPYLLRVEDKAWLDEMAARREAQRAGV
jgi:hypothetical protein